MNRRIAAALAATATVLALTACTPTAEPTPTPTATITTPTPTPTAGAAPRQNQEDPPADQEAAITTANAVYQKFRDLNLDFVKDVALGTAYMSGYVAPDSPAWTTLENTIANGGGTVVSGGPFGWTLNNSMSYAGDLTVIATGEKIPNGVVYLYGCGDNSKVVFKDPNVPKGSFPVKAQLNYQPDQKVWLVYESKSMRPTDGEVMPQC